MFISGHGCVYFPTIFCFLKAGYSYYESIR